MTSSLDASRAGSPGRSRQTGLLLAGDIGGTKTALGVYSAERGARMPLVEGELPSAKYPSLVALVREFVAGADLSIERASFAVAGPVIAGSSRVTNLSWGIEEAELTSELDLKSVHLMNDLEAVAAALPLLGDADLHPINRGEPVAGGAIGVIAPGTGLGEAFLIYDGSRYRAFPSEGGHASFAPSTQLEVGLLGYLLRKYEHVSVERVCSGPGLFNIYQYLRESGGPPESAELVRQLAAAEDQPKVIGEAALRPDPDPLSRASLELCVSILGAEAGNLALKVLSTGGIYLAGGVPQRTLPALGSDRFMRAFVAKGRLGPLLARIPVQVITTQGALIGAAHTGLELSAHPQH
jgi:glucokinase